MFLILVEATADSPRRRSELSPELPRPRTARRLFNVPTSTYAVVPRTTNDSTPLAPPDCSLMSPEPLPCTTGRSSSRLSA